MNVVRRESEETIGAVQDVLVHPTEGCVVALLIEGPDGRRRVIDVCDFEVRGDVVLARPGSAAGGATLRAALLLGVRATKRLLGMEMISDSRNAMEPATGCGGYVGCVRDVFVLPRGGAIAYRVEDASSRPGGFFLAGSVSRVSSKSDHRLEVPRESARRYGACTPAEAIRRAGTVSADTCLGIRPPFVIRRTAAVYTPRVRGYRRVRALAHLARRRSRGAGSPYLRLLLVLLPAERQRVFALTLVAGVACGLAAVAFHLLIRLVERLLIDRAVAAPGPWWIALTVVVPAAGGLVCGLLLHYVVPDARGSGIPQVKVAYAVKGGRIPLGTTIGKFFVGALQIGSGASLGREGPTVQVCAGIASWIGRASALPRSSLRRMLPVGAAAGIAAAFNAPIAAVTFTIEEVVGDLDQTILSGVVVAAALAAAVERGVLGERSVFEIPLGYGLHHVSSLVFYAVLGVAAAVVSVTFTDSLLRVRAFFKARATTVPWAHPAVGGLVTGVLAVVALGWLGTAGVTGGGYETLSSALDGRVGVRVMLALCALKLVATAFSYGSGGAGGIFAPSLFVGGMLGGAVGWLDVAILGHAPNEVGAFALVGMGAAFAGIVRAPITSVLIIFEMTDGYSLVLPLMIANMVAYGLAKRWRPVPVYEALLEQDGIHLPSRGPISHALELVDVASAMTRAPDRVGADTPVARALERATETGRTALPVVAAGRCVGLVTEARLRRAAAEGRGDAAVGEITDGARTVYDDASLARALVRMHKQDVRQLAVVERESASLVGILTMSDVLRAQARAVQSTGDVDVTIAPATGRARDA